MLLSLPVKVIENLVMFSFLLSFRVEATRWKEVGGGEPTEFGVSFNVDSLLPG
jgi:hypothetical protein